MTTLSSSTWARTPWCVDPPAPRPQQGLVPHSDAGGQAIHVKISTPSASAASGRRRASGTIGDSWNNAIAESVMGLFKTELHRNPAALAANGGPGRASTDLRDRHLCPDGVVVQQERLHFEDSTTRAPDGSRTTTVTSLSPEVA